MDAYINNFSSIWGQAVQAYEATLVPDRTPYDLGTLTPAQLNGLNTFRNRGCAVCHVEPEFTDASVRLIALNGGPGQPKLIGGQPAGDQGVPQHRRLCDGAGPRAGGQSGRGP